MLKKHLHLKYSRSSTMPLHRIKVFSFDHYAHMRYKYIYKCTKNETQVLFPICCSSLKFFSISWRPSGILPLSSSWHHFWYLISSSLNTIFALSRSNIRSSKYWYRSFFRALHSLADCRLLSSFDFMSVLWFFWPGFRPRFDFIGCNNKQIKVHNLKAGLNGRHIFSHIQIYVLKYFEQYIDLLLLKFFSKDRVVRIAAFVATGFGYRLW